MLRAGLFDDPFFFDLLAFRNNLAFCAGGSSDFFRGLNTLAIVLELPNNQLGSGPIGVWARTAQGGRTVDRMGRPAINTVFIPSSLKDAFKPASRQTTGERSEISSRKNCRRSVPAHQLDVRLSMAVDSGNR